MNLRQGVFVGSIGVSSILSPAWLLAVEKGMSFIDSLFGVLLSLGITGILVICIIGALTIYEALN